MNIQIFGKSKCFDTKKAQRYFKERRIKFQYIDILDKGLSHGEYRSVAQAVGGFDEIVDKKSKDYYMIQYIGPEQQEEKLMENSKEMGKVLGEILEALKAKHPSVGDVRYIGLFSGIELVKDKATKEPLVPYAKDPEGIMKKVLSKLKEKGFWNYSHDNTLIIAPPLVINEEQLREAMNIMDEVLDYVDSII